MNNNISNMNKKINSICGAGAIALAALFATTISCSEIEDGVNDIDSWEKVESYVPEDGLPHPCMLNTDEDFEYIKEKLAGNEQPWTNAFNHMTRADNTYTQKGYKPTPVAKLARLDATNWGPKDRWEREGIADDWYDGIHANYMNFSHDCAAAYAQAILWKITGDEGYASTAVNILNKWASTCKGYIVGKDGTFIDPNEALIALEVYQIANAAELMRSYDGWSSSDFTTFKNWIVDVFYPFNSSFLSGHGSADCPLHEWFNWDLAQMTSMLAIGILTDDNFKINEAIQYYKYGVGSGMVYNGIPFTHADPDSQETLGQCQESGRDQGHAALCSAMLAIFCRMAANIGEDLLAYADYRALSMFEYHAKYNVGSSEQKSADGKSWYMTGFLYSASQVPYTTLEKCTSTEASKEWPTISYEEHQNGNETRGVLNPGWELVCRLAEDAGQSAIYSTKIRDLMRTNAQRGYCDGGAGDYGPDSGGFDIFGWGTLLYAKNAVNE